MTTKTDLYRLIEALPDDLTDEAGRRLTELHNPARYPVLDVPLDDEPEADAERAAVAEAYADRDAGRWISGEELDREFGFSPDSALG